MKVLYLLSLAIAAFGSDVDDPDVLVLTDSNFDATVNSADIILVEFYAPWCGHCKHLAPEYAKAATALKREDPPIPLAKVDATVESSLASRFGIQGYPTLKVFRNGVASEYSGPRDANGIANYMRKQAGPAAKPLTTEEALTKFLAFNEDVSVVGYFKDSNSADAKAFIQVSNSLRDDYRFGIVQTPSLIQEEGVVIHRPFVGDEPKVKFAGKYTADDLRKFINQNSVATAGLYSNNIAKRFNLPRVTLFAKADRVADAKQITYYLNRLRKVAKDYLGQLHFVLADKSEQGADWQALNFGDAKWGLAVISSAGKWKFTGDSFSPETLRQFVQDFVAGKVEKYLKSEPVPEEQTKDGLTTIVGKTFDAIVNDPSKDVLIEFYAPWCGHCKSLAPKWEKLAKEFEDVESVVIAKIDATANDIPSNFGVRGYPTIYLAKANDKANPVSYDGEREVKALKKWLKQQASIPIAKKDL